MPQRVQLPKGGEQFPILHATLRKPQPGVKNNVLGMNPGGNQAITQGGELVQHLGDGAARVGGERIHCG